MAPELSQGRPKIRQRHLQHWLPDELLPTDSGAGKIQISRPICKTVWPSRVNRKMGMEFIGMIMTLEQLLNDCKEKNEIPVEITDVQSRNSYLKQTYGITLKDYNEMVTRQNKKCAICGRSQSEFPRRLFVDHDHKTGKVRGLLCPGCNLGLGYFEKYKEEMQSYLNGQK